MTCPYCKVTVHKSFKLDCGEAIESHPVPGEYAVCGACMGILIYKGNELAIPTHSELDRFHKRHEDHIEHEAAMRSKAQWN